MGLHSGSKLGPYEIGALLGAGGMGEVYRARDTRLERAVAIKVLPSSLSSDPSLRQRLEREAKSISRLSHPHICALHDIGHEDGMDFLVMEYLEGETLEHRLLRGPLPPEQTIRYAAEIADALANAHKLGVIHRDLKPSNVMLTKAGAKLMDFGLAKQTGAVSVAGDLTQLTMEEAKLTDRGAIVGTFQYMAPEQLEGKEVDTRTDIFALGEVIYEMATGQPAFSGGSRASLIAAILTKDPPPVTQLQPMAPPALDRVVKKCLAKDPEDRWQSANDLTSELRWMAESGSQARAAAVTLEHGWFGSAGRWWLAPWALILALVFALAILSWRQFVKAKSPPVVHVAVSLPPKVLFGPAAWPLFALSRDGTQLVFSGVENGVTQLYLRRMDQWDSVPIRGTVGATRPFLSPDGQWVAFTAGRSLKKVAIGGGPTIDLAELDWGGGSWGSNDQIVYTRAYNSGLWKISATGGSPQMLTSPDHSRGELAHWWPQILPDGDNVLFTSFSTPIERSSIVVRSLKTGKQRTLIEGGTFARYLPPGYLIFSRGETVIAVPFDLRKLELAGAPVPVLEGVACLPQNGDSQFAVSESGTLAFLLTSVIATEQKLVSIDRQGKIQTLRDNIHLHGGLRLSPDGQRIALGLREAGHPPDIWVQNLARGSLSRLTHGPASNFNPLWTPDGRQLLYVSERPVFEIYRKSADGGGNEDAVLATPNDKFPESISADGKTLLFSTNDPNTRSDLWTISLTEGNQAKPFVATPFDEGGGTFSPDGRWVAYQSDESGKVEIYVTDFPARGNRVQVSTDGGSEPVWARNGKELFYRSGKKLFSVPVTFGTHFAAGTPKLLFEHEFVFSSEKGNAYDASADGQRFYFVQQESRADQEALLNFVLNWSEELTRLAPVRQER